MNDALDKNSIYLMISTGIMSFLGLIVGFSVLGLNIVLISFSSFF